MKKLAARLSMVYVAQKERRTGKVATILIVAFLAASAYAAPGKGAGIIP